MARFGDRLIFSRQSRAHKNSHHVTRSSDRAFAQLLDRNPKPQLIIDRVGYRDITLDREKRDMILIAIIPKDPPATGDDETDAFVPCPAFSTMPAAK